MQGSLSTAFSGLLSHQQRMDVIADDIANTNTTGFKTSNMSFIDSFHQAWMSPNEKNPTGIQIGTGNRIAVVNQDFTQGAFQRTGVNTDVALSGEGFMVLNSGVNGAGIPYFSRDGAFTLDKGGYLINSLGYHVRGASATWSSGAGFPAIGAQAADPGVAAPSSIGDLRIPSAFTSGAMTEALRSFSIDVNGKITLYAESGNSYVSGYITLAKFDNPQGLDKKGSNLFAFNEAARSLSGGSSFSETGDVRKAGTNGCATTQSGALELSNVDLANVFTDMVITQRAYDANAKVVTTTDEMLQIAAGLKR